ncbi:MAG: class I SAM-dependent methyltransferase [Myxococcota bacterium]|nr:class I SAM-dependent methyltransferase [Myxococcota bacterium]
MDEATRKRLLAINRDFYTQQAASFSATRNHAWPGWARVVDGLAPDPLAVLDAGCGNGRLARFLGERREQALDYLGIDSSAALIDDARKAIPTPGIHFAVLDLVESPEAIPAGPFDLVAVFGLLHHLPGFETRVNLVRQLASRLARGGRIAVTCWRFGADPRIEGRLLDWDGIVDPSRLDPGDHLLRWGNSPGVGRYCHFASDDEIDEFAQSVSATGLGLADRFRSDGKSGELNEYLVWSPQ